MEMFEFIVVIVITVDGPCSTVQDSCRLNGSHCVPQQKNIFVMKNFKKMKNEQNAKDGSNR
eukprot:scaffold802_cov95-Amphora_coffeaeformis.AAC.2